MAELQKASGNASFTAGKYEEAAKFYEKAVSLAPKDPVYLSNLSAAQFELGKYDSCVTTIVKAGPLLAGASDALKRKLSHRLARALCHNRMSSQADVSVDAAVIERFEAFVQSDAPVDVRSAWDLWHRVRAPDLQRLRREAEQALSKQRHFKNMQASFGLEYYTVGQDDAETLLASDPLMPDIDITRFKNPQLSELSFLFGGCGDCRHAFGSLIDVHQESLGLKAAQRAALRLNMSLVDIHPTTIARVLLYLTFLGQLADSLGTDDEEEAAAVFLYMFFAPVIPPYVHRRAIAAMEQIIRQLQTSALPKWIICSVDPEPVIAGLRHWINLQVDTRHYMQHVEVHVTKDPVQMLEGMRAQGMQVSQEYIDGMKAGRARGEEQVMQQHLKIPDARLRELVPGGKSMARAQLRSHIQQAIKKNMPFFVDRIAKAGMKEEDQVFPRLKTFLPCYKLLMKYHEPMIPLVRDIAAMTINPYDLKDPPAGLPKPESLRQAEAHMYRDWRVNPLTFDRNMPRESASGYKPCLWDVFGLISGFEQKLGPRIRDGSKPDNTKVAAVAFERGTLFFTRTAKAFKAMRGHITFEVVLGDVYHWLDLQRLGLARPEDSPLPKQFTRMWFNNVPDYGGGPLNLAVYATPCLQPLSTAGALFNCLLNAGTWKSMDHYNFHHSLMNINEMPRLLGCELHTRTMSDNMALSVCQSRTLQHVQRPELTNWLIRVLVQLVYHGRSGMGTTGSRIDTPNTLAFFIRVLIYLGSKGVPAHVLADILQNVLLDKISSDIRPYTGLLPIVSQGMHTGKPRKLYLAPWIAELEAFVAQARYALPFALQLPSTFPGPNDLVTCEVDARIFNDYLLGNTLRQPALALLMYSPSFDIRRLADLYPRLLEGQHARDAAVFTCFDIDRDRHTVSWKTSSQRANAARAAKWEVCVFRLENCKLVTDVIPASKWRLPAPQLEMEPLD
ncbi:hypothetical protein EXIGLDRAFT_828752 [Exidia glandulosa HHB12029]|uniref:DUF4470 domain-containing protein n=1 Tax=Exidia glandulosa HHB12029 TaxID=1314781 RepID=A0A165Q1V6_EXIGL|nr:hypothetical protein EXIGLDRAFT_828752 [Exidia glandulosa HHB12029]